MPQQLLIVEPDGLIAERLAEAVKAYARVDTASDFATARTLLATRSYDWLVSNVRLGEYNGLHLVHLNSTNLAARNTLIYDDHADPWLAGEARRIGAFYERGEHIVEAMPCYLRDEAADDDRDPTVVATDPVLTLSGDPIVVTYRIERRRPMVDSLES